MMAVFIYEEYSRRGAPANLLDGLQCEADKDQTHSKDTHPLLGHMICNSFDERRARARDRRDRSNHQSGFHPDAERVRALMRR